MLGSVDKKGAGEFTLPGLFKVSVQKVPAKAAPARIRSPAKSAGSPPPASVKVKVRPLKKLKDAAQ